MFYKGKHKIGIWLVIIALIIASCPGYASSGCQFIQTRWEDGVVLRVHLSEERGKDEYNYALQVLQAACYAYKEIVYRHRFNRNGYAFASAARNFAYDKDRVIDIYIKDVATPTVSMPRYDNFEYQARIFVPKDYESYRKRYHIEHPQLELKASLMHELLHIVTYSYNRNMQAASQGKVSLTSKRWDWYTEGLARYFEALAGYRQEFLSCGFRYYDGDKIMVYKGGVNYFLRYPDKPLAERKYDFALFWQYLHENFGMEKIEEISARFRRLDPWHCSHQQAMQIIAQTLDVPLKNLLRNFSLYVYKVSVLADKAQDGLEPVHTTKFTSRKTAVFSICDFGLNYYELALKPNLKSVQLESINNKKDLNCLIGIRSPFSFTSMPLEPDSSGKITVDTSFYPPHSKMLIMLSNPTDEAIFYQISVN